MSSATEQRLASLLEANSAGILTCVHCGLCLPSCPTYLELGNENDSPRGRIYLMRAFVEGRLAANEVFSTHIDLCLGCRACETACPSGVPYGQLLEAARVEVARTPLKRGSLTGAITRFVLNRVFTRPRLLRATMAVARFVRNRGIAQLAFESGVAGRLRIALGLLLATKPRGRYPDHSQDLRPSNQSSSSQSRSLRVALLHGCVMDGLFRHTNAATERVLGRNGCEIVEANGEVCCGALHSHAGEIEAARQLARINIDAFMASGCDRIIVNAAGCGAAMKEYQHLLAEDPDYSDRAREFSARVRDVSEFLCEAGIESPASRLRRRVAYDAPCHLLHAQRLATAPVEVLEKVPGVEFVTLRGSEGCCGGAGIYNLLHAEISSSILSEKLDNILGCGADTVATGNPGCIMQIGAGLLMRGSDIAVVHPVELLDAAYRLQKL